MQKKMQKRAATFMLAFALALVICGAAAAADNSTSGPAGNASVSSAAATSTPASTTSAATTTAASTSTSTTPASTTTNTASAPAASNQPTTNAPAVSNQPTVAPSGSQSSGAGGLIQIVGSPKCYQTIQCAVNKAHCGDTIIIGCGVYKENVVIDKLLTLIGQAGAVVVACDDDDPVFTINSCGSGTTIEGFTIMGGSDGIELNHANGCEIKCNKIVSNKDGIELNNADWNCIKDNEIKYNLDDGISLRNSEGNTIKDNKITTNGDDGISLYRSEGNKITDNKINSNLDDGVSLYNSDWNKITGNEINKNYDDGVVLYESNGNDVKCNDITNNRGAGLYIAGSKGNEINNNNIKTCVPCSTCVYVRDTDRTSEYNEIHYNNLIADGPHTYAIINNSRKKLNAQCNWFGSDRDPKCKIGGCGVTLYRPWLKSPVKVCKEKCCDHKNICKPCKKERKHHKVCKPCNPKEVTKETKVMVKAKAVKVAATTKAAGVAMQTTGAPIALLALALLVLFGGLLPRRK